MPEAGIARNKKKLAWKLVGRGGKVSCILNHGIVCAVVISCNLLLDRLWKGLPYPITNTLDGPQRQFSSDWWHKDTCVSIGKETDIFQAVSGYITELLCIKAFITNTATSSWIKAFSEINFFYKIWTFLWIRVCYYNLTLCRLVNSYRHFREACCFHLHGLQSKTAQSTLLRNVCHYRVNQSLLCKFPGYSNRQQHAVRTCCCWYLFQVNTRTTVYVSAAQIRVLV
jgi:hypothetical protein